MKRLCIVMAVMLWTVVAFAATGQVAEEGTQSLRPLPVTLEGSVPTVAPVPAASPRREPSPVSAEPNAAAASAATPLVEVIFGMIFFAAIVILILGPFIALFGGLMGKWVIFFDQEDVVASMNPYWAIKQSIMDNQSTVVGVLAGLLKIFLAWILFFKGLGALGTIYGKSSRLGGTYKANSQLRTFKLVSPFLMNASKVYGKKGWPPHRHP